LINVKIVFQYYAGTRSLYIQEGRQDKGRKTAPPRRCLGTQSCPDATSGPSSPDAHYSDTTRGNELANVSAAKSISADLQLTRTLHLFPYTPLETGRFRCGRKPQEDRVVRPRP